MFGLRLTGPFYNGWFNGNRTFASTFFNHRILHVFNTATGTTTASNPLRGIRPMPKTEQVNEFGNLKQIG